VSPVELAKVLLLLGLIEAVTNTTSQTKRFHLLLISINRDKSTHISYSQEPSYKGKRNQLLQTLREQQD
jgi:hypothetical protein